MKDFFESTKRFSYKRITLGNAMKNIFLKKINFYSQKALL
jgi:hypothetical protein